MRQGIEAPGSPAFSTDGSRGDALLRRMLRCRPALRPPRRGCCLQVDRPPETPDLAIYSQGLQFAEGQAPDWDNPDIKTNRWSPWRLYPALPVTVRNLSPTAHAVHALVHLEVARFGINTPRRPMGSKRVTVPAGGAVELEFPLDQAALDAGPLIAAHVTLEHPHDRNRLNNEGAQAIDGLTTAEDGRSRQLVIPVVNDATVAQSVTLAVAAQDVTAQLSASSLQLSPGEESSVTLSTTVPDSLHAPAGGEERRHVIVTATNGQGALLGGITQIVRVTD